MSLRDDSYGEVSIVHEDEFDIYVVHADFKKQGSTQLILTSPEGKETVCALTAGRNTFQLDLIE